MSQNYLELLLTKLKLYKTMIFNEIETLEIKGRFKYLPYLVCSVDSKLFQLTHFKKRRTCYFKEIKYNEKRKGYRINSVWISKNTLLNRYYECREIIEI